MVGVGENDAATRPAEEHSALHGRLGVGEAVPHRWTRETRCRNETKVPKNARSHDMAQTSKREEHDDHKQARHVDAEGPHSSPRSAAAPGLFPRPPPRDSDKQVEQRDEDARENQVGHVLNDKQGEHKRDNKEKGRQHHDHERSAIRLQRERGVVEGPHERQETSNDVHAATDHKDKQEAIDDAHNEFEQGTVDDGKERGQEDLGEVAEEQDPIGDRQLLQDIQRAVGQDHERHKPQRQQATR